MRRAVRHTYHGVEHAGRRWLWCTLLAAIVVSAADAALIGRTRGIFTGGFLSQEHLDSWGERASFAALSLASDAAFAGLLTALALFIATKLRLRAAAGFLLAFSVAVVPLIVSDVVSYELFAYLGDAFDVSLMFDLSGRSLREFLAVTSAHLLMPALLLATALGVTAVAVALVQRMSSGPHIRQVVTPIFPVALLIAGFAVHAWARTSSDLLDDALRRKPVGKLFGAIAEGMTDLDRDGYGILRQPRDPAWLDGAVYPYAIDWPGNGVDENGLAGDVPAGTGEYVEQPAVNPHFAQRPDVLLIVLESFRADAVGARENGKPVTPTLDSLTGSGAAAGVAYSHNGYTTRSRRHLFTGSLAHLGGAGTLIDDFQANGYEVAYFSGQDETFGGDELSIHPEKADVFYDARQDAARRYSTFASAGSLAVPFDVVLERVGEFLQKRDAEKPLFLYVNFHDTHFPYWHDGVKPLVGDTRVAQSDIGPDRADDLRRMYMNTAANVDAAIGVLLSDARDALGHEPAVIVTSDHGESLYDEGFLGHGYALNDSQTRVPLIVSGLAMEIVEPFAQSSLRGAMVEALSKDPENGGPTVRRSPDGMVFQYLGSLERPRQIAFTGLARQDVYDFRDNRANVGNSGWKSPDALTPAQAAVLIDLVRFWERLRLAQAREGAGE